MNGQTARQMAEADRLSVVSGLSVIELMDRSAVAREIGLRWTARPVIVLCGPGDNGGDGFVAARRFVEAGWPVALLGSRESLKGAASHHAQLWQGQVETLSPAVLDGAELVVDAIFGSGLTRKLGGSAAETLAAAAGKRLELVAADVPCGLMGDTGEALGAQTTVYPMREANRALADLRARRFKGGAVLVP